ncbi:carbohydrate-binding module family 66 protein [Xylariaceae sp. FL0255]|nr:carbohydrate-binding module family 66 protein [Xylariaceae sp. FL0255]
MPSPPGIDKSRVPDKTTSESVCASSPRIFEVHWAHFFMFLFTVSADLNYTTSEAGNPFFYEGKFWVFATSSLPYHQQTYMDAFSSPDLINWEKHTNILITRDIKWAEGALWAPAPIFRNGKYYLYFGANDIQEGQPEAGFVGGIGVAVADRPEGPYVDAIGTPLIGEYHHGAQPIDQAVFLDDDGQAYIFYGGHSHCNMAKLNDDMVSIGQFNDGTSYIEITPEGYVESAQMFKRKGKYYLMWSEGGWTGPDYSVSYAMSDSIMGPFKNEVKILQQDPAVARGSGHNGVINVPGTDIWYIVYHRRPLSETNGNHRVLAYDRMYFNADGTIVPVKMLVHDNFADGEAIAWKHYGNGMSVIQQRLQSKGPAVSMLDTNFGDLIFDATISIPNAEGEAGLLFRTTTGMIDIELTKLSGYHVKISAVSGGTTLEKILHGHTSTLGHDVADIDVGIEHQVRLTAVGPKIEVFVDDMQAPKLEILDHSFAKGSNGVKASTAGARFGGVSVTRQ